MQLSYSTTRFRMKRVEVSTLTFVTDSSSVFCSRLRSEGVETAIMRSSKARAGRKGRTKVGPEKKLNKFRVICFPSSFHPPPP